MNTRILLKDIPSYGEKGCKPLEGLAYYSEGGVVIRQISIQTLVDGEWKDIEVVDEKHFKPLPKP